MSPEPTAPAPPWLEARERKELLRIAREAIEGYLRERRMPAAAVSPGKLSEPGAAFVTLKKKGRLRGCIGTTEPVEPLGEVVRECAVSAATRDPRFRPVTPDEMPSIEIEISVLTPLVPIRPEEVEVGRHGLMVAQGRMRGLLLPQVPVELGWDRETFLDQTCVKAGLPTDAWRCGATLQAFTAEVFGEEGAG